MGLSYCKLFTAIIFLLIIVLSNIGSIACAQEQCSDLNTLEGEWYVVEEVDGTDCGEGISTETYVVTISLNGCDVTYKDFCGTYTGTIVDNTLDLTGECFEDGGVSTIQGGGYFFSDGMVRGSTTWVWTDGVYSCSGTTNFTANVAPHATVISPSDGDIFKENDPVTFKGLNSDFEEGTLGSNSLVWTSNIDGEIGTDDLFTRNLSPGVHIIKFKATDNGLPGVDNSRMDDVDSITLAFQSGIGTGFIVGNVYDSTDGTPIVGARIVSDFGGTAVSIEGGYYYLELPSGTYTTTCTSNGYSNASSSGIIVEPGTITASDIRMSSTPSGTNPIPDIKANGSGNSITVGTGDTLSMTVSLSAGDSLGADGDWWLVVNTPNGEWEYFDLTSGAYTPGLSPTIQGFSLIDLGPTVILNTSDLGAGTYTYYFAVDLGGGQLFWDSVVVNITP